MPPSSPLVNTDIPTKTSEMRPTSTSTPPTPTSVPTQITLSFNGPYILLSGSNGIWLGNADGSVLTHISDLDPGLVDLHKAVSSNGKKMAVVSHTDQGLDLVEITLPAGDHRIIAHLLDISQDELVTNPTGRKAFASYAIAQYDSIAWQPGEGRFLAFIGAMNGPTADLYVYDTQTEEITQLTDGDSQAINPIWSPDGQYILHFGVSWIPPFGGAIVGYNRLDGVWAVRMVDEKVLTLPKPKGTSTNFVGWQDDAHYITYDSDDTCFSRNLRAVDVQTGKASPIAKYSFYYSPALSPENGAILFSGSAGCPESPGNGVFLLKPDKKEPIQISTKKAYEVNWMPESGVFNAYPELLVSSDGDIQYLPPVYDKSYEPAISKMGYEAWEVIENFKGRVVVRTPGTDWRIVLDGLVDELIWDPVSGETLIMAMQDGMIYSASYPNFEPHTIGNIPGGVNQAIWIR